MRETGGYTYVACGCATRRHSNDRNADGDIGKRHRRTWGHPTDNAHLMVAIANATTRATMVTRAIRSTRIYVCNTHQCGAYGCGGGGGHRASGTRMDMTANRTTRAVTSERARCDRDHGNHHDRTYMGGGATPCACTHLCCVHKHNRRAERSTTPMVPHTWIHTSTAYIV